MQMYTRLVVTQVYVEKMFNKNIGFQSVIFHLCRQALVPLLRNEMERLLFRARENWQSTSYN